MQRRVEVYDQGGVLLFTAVDPSKANELKKLGHDEMLIMQAVERSGDAGIWTRNLKLQTKLQDVQVRRIIKKLENRKLIKAVKSITHKNRKMYIGFHVKPSRELTGGPWYQDQELDHMFIELLRKTVYSMIAKRGTMTRVEITADVKKTGVLKVDLGVEDIQQILDTLIYDRMIDVLPSALDELDDYGDDAAGLAAASASSSSSSAASTIGAATSVSGCNNRTRFKVATLPDAIDGFTSTPCGVCPVSAACTPGGAVSPERCVYIDTWLEAF